MQHEITTRLTAIRHRQEKRLVGAGLASGLLAGSIVALAAGGMAAATRWLPLPAAPGRYWVLVVLSSLAGVAIVAGMMLGVARRGRLPAGLATVAALVDAQCGLKDRLRTALEFLEKTDRNPIEDLQIAETTGHLPQVDPIELVPATSSRSYLAGILFSLAAGGLIAWAWLGPANQPSSTAAFGPVSPGGHAGKAAAAKESIARLAAEPTPALSDPRWGPAPAARVAPARASLGAGPTLEEILAESPRAEASGSAAVMPAQSDASPTADQDESLPLEYRQMLRRYFESIRPREELLN
jgi:hypothetical protein